MGFAGAQPILRVSYESAEQEIEQERRALARVAAAGRILVGVPMLPRAERLRARRACIAPAPARRGRGRSLLVLITADGRAFRRLPVIPTNVFAVAAALIALLFVARGFSLLGVAAAARA